ncbi:MAG: hypothetical protein L0211_16400 [Planctomycetaceae bacterium]|nr:hypothetical protein [Planctomycetaceae bacterium]
MKIVINGREYSSPDELPAEAREGYERAMSALADKNGNGIPDTLEMHLDPDKLRAAMSGATAAATVITAQKFIINGREYNSVGEMSPQDRRHFEAIQSLTSGSNVPPIRTTLDPLNPAEWAPSRGTVATDPTTMIFLGIFIGMVIAVIALGAFFFIWRLLS